MRESDATSRLVVASAALVVLLGCAAGQAAGQEAGSWSLDFRGGVVIPAGDLADLTDVGPSAGVGVAHWLSSRTALRLDGEFQLLQRGDLDGLSVSPRVRLWNGTGGVQLRFKNPEPDDPWVVTLHGGVGGFVMNSDTFIPELDGEGEPVFAKVDELYFNTLAGLEVGYEFGESVALLLSGRWYLLLVDSDDMQAFTDFSDGVVSPFSTGHSIPVSVTVRVLF